MTSPRIPAVLLTVTLILAPGLALARHPRSVQEGSTKAQVGALTAEERSAIESTVLSDKRVRLMVGEEKPCP